MSKNKGCVGSYPVSGYTRRDGTEVSGYTRSCGAAHASQEDKMQIRADILYPSMNVLEGRVEKNEYPEGNEPQGGESPEEGTPQKENPKEDKKVDWGKIFEKVAEGLENVKTTPLLGQSIYDEQNTEIPQSQERRIARPTREIGLRSLNKQSQQQGVGATKKEKDYDEIANVFYPTMSDNKAVEILKEKGKQELSEIEKERWKEHAKNFGGAAIEIASAFAPGTAQFKLATKIATALTPKFGRVLAQEVATGVVKGAISGGTYGLGDAMLNDEDLLFNVLENATLGVATGGGIGLATGKISLASKTNKLNDLLEKRSDWGIAYKKYSYKPEEAIEKLLEEKQGFVPNAIYKKGIGDIDFVWGDSNGGLCHILERRNTQGIDGEEFIRQIPEIIKNGKVIEKQGHSHRKYILEKDNEVVIRLDWNQKDRRWLVTSYIKY